ncbi:MAG TPA: bifunctional hydroxymethylpyrimidine kinase/phosphomethylpyrimidine kinase [Anaeromyxobacteraceae bacterium]|nr:bifunctional hydroxymethylpyrimidine kinase/phosphomethylpyrimidine kinase [Anaeromyxobacteraceae bacterium]
MRVALTIAGSDSGGGAGIQTDLHAFAAHGLHGTSAITAVTAQNSTGVRAWAVVDPALVEAQIDAVASDMPVAAAKTGMLGTAAVVEAVVGALRRHRTGPLVVDPVMVARSGDRLVDASAQRAYVELLLPLAALLTPNLQEAEALLGRPVRDLDAMRRAARDLAALGPAAVLVKGGALPGGEAVDVLFDGSTIADVAGPRIDTPNTHGTGCTLGAAITARLALGDAVADAVRGGKAYLERALRASYAVGHGRGCVRHHGVVAPGRTAG